MMTGDELKWTEATFLVSLVPDPIAGGRRRADVSGETGGTEKAFDDCVLLTISSAVSLDPAWKWSVAGVGPPISI